MGSFKDLCFTPAEFAAIAKIDRTAIPALEQLGLIKTIKRRVGNVDRKMIPLEEMQNYFKAVRGDDYIGRRGDQASDSALPELASMPSSELSLEAQMANEVAALTSSVAAIPTEIPRQMGTGAEVAAATDFAVKLPNLKVQMFYNVKGGTGKSTLTAQYVMRAAMLGLNVLAIDLDGQGHLSVNLDVLDAHERPTVYDVLINELPLEKAIMNVAPGLDLVPASLGLCNIEIPLNMKPRREYRLAEAIEKIAGRYDLIVADTNPAASILNSSMLVATNLVNIVCATNPLSFHGMSLVMATIEQMEKEFRRELEVRIIPNLYDNREIISQEVLGELRSRFPEYCTQAVINRSADLNEATKRRTTVWDVSSKGIASKDINAMTEELLFN